MEGVSTILCPWRGRSCAGAGHGLTHIVFLLVVELSAARDDGGRGARVGAGLLIVCLVVSRGVCGGHAQCSHRLRRTKSEYDVPHFPGAMIVAGCVCATTVSECGDKVLTGEARCLCERERKRSGGSGLFRNYERK